MNKSSYKKIKLTEFQKKVYRCVRGIPLGEVRTYSWVARKIGRPRAYRAVGSALARSPFVFFIPCHRVVKARGDIGSYSLGRDLKQKLINMEKTIKGVIK